MTSNIVKTVEVGKFPMKSDKYKYEIRPPRFEKPMTLSRIKERVNAAQFFPDADEEKEEGCDDSPIAKIILSTKIIYFRADKFTHDPEYCHAIVSIYINMAVEKLIELGKKVDDNSYLFDINIPLRGRKTPIEVFYCHPRDSRVFNILVGCEPDGRPRQERIVTTKEINESSWSENPETVEVVKYRELPSYIPFCELDFPVCIIDKEMDEINEGKEDKILSPEEAGIDTYDSISFWRYIGIDKGEGYDYSVLFGQYSDDPRYDNAWVSVEFLQYEFSKFNSSKKTKVVKDDRGFDKTVPYYPKIVIKNGKNIYIEFDPETSDAVDALSMKKYMTAVHPKDKDRRATFNFNYSRFNPSQIANYRSNQAYNSPSRNVSGPDDDGWVVVGKHERKGGHHSDGRGRSRGRGGRGRARGRE